VEFAGALYELIYGNLRKDFRRLDFRQVRIVVLEALDSLLPGMHKRLGRYAFDRLHKMGVEVRLKTPVSRIARDAVSLRGGDTIPTGTVVWTAGHRGHPLAAASGLPTNRRGQVAVESTLQLPGHPNVYVVGDLAALTVDGKPLPMVAPVAMQQGEAAAENILRQIRGQEPQPFGYRDNGMLAVIGRNAAVADFGRLSFTGFFAWLLWLVVHLVKLIGFRNRLQVLVNWAWSYFFFDKAAGAIVPAEAARRQREAEKEAQGSAGTKTRGRE
jgi:NADH dehydrogenase